MPRVLGRIMIRDFGLLLGERALVRRWRVSKLGHEVLPERDCRSKADLRGDFFYRELRRLQKLLGSRNPLGRHPVADVVPVASLKRRVKVRRLMRATPARSSSASGCAGFSRPNSFLKTDLKQMLDSEAVENVSIVGAMSHMCIDATTRAASDFGYKTTVVHDACATRDVEFRGRTVPAAQVHAALMSALGFAYATIVTTDEYLAG
jgi:hypothetical protein